jgi:transcription antitermination factor NusG
MRRHWTIIETHSATSRKTVGTLVGTGVDHYHPEYRAPLFNGGRLTCSLFPCYVFVRCTSDEHAGLFKAKGVKRVFPLSKHLHRELRSLVARLRAMEDRRGYVDVDRMFINREHERFEPGQDVRGLHGMLQGITAKFVEYVEDGYARVSTSILGGRELVATVDAHELIGVW